MELGSPFKLIPMKLSSLVLIPVTDRNGGLFPFLLLGNGEISLSAAKFALALSREGWSDEKIHQCLKAVGRFYTFHSAKYQDSKNNLLSGHEIIGSYAETRFRGSISAGGNDETNLFWTRVNFTTVGREIYYLNLFSDFCNRYLSSININPTEDRFIKTFKSYKDLRNQGLSDALVHLDGVRKGRKPRYYELNKKNADSNQRLPKYLTTNLLIDLIEDGCRNPRDKMLLLLMGFGGLRISEPLHIYTFDVMRNFNSTNASRIILAHPSNGIIETNKNDKLLKIKRADYLRESFKRLPRNEMGKGHIEYVGWKGMLLDKQEYEENYVFWLEEDITGGYFRKLLENYISENRSLFIGNRLNHPYLFFNIQKDRNIELYGKPLTYMNAQEVFYAACKRINLKGYSPHSCRHHYGFYTANFLKLQPETLQRMLRHRQITSTDVYYHMTSQFIRSQISEDEMHSNNINEQVKKSFPSHWIYN
ncbi:MAG TPA: tyrosine-type recombinase/integrase [Methylophilus sp.]